MSDERGRPSKLTPEALDEIVKAIEGGASYKIAAGCADASYDSLNYWKKVGKEHITHGIDSIYSNFYKAVKKAHSKRATKWLKKIEEAGDQHWTAAAWLLERCHREDYSKDAADLQEVKRLHAEMKEMVEKSGLN